MPERLMSHKWVITGFVIVVVGVVVWLWVRPLFWSTRRHAISEKADEMMTKPIFTNVTIPAGFTHVHHKPRLDPKLEPIMPWVSSVGAAAAAGDFDNDGWVDLYVTDSDKGKHNHLYRNQGNGTFVDVGEKAGVANVNDESGTSMDCVWGDYDNDGDLDLFVVKWGRDILFRNNGDGTFTDVSTKAFRNEKNEPGSPWANGCSAVWVDYDCDGWLDLYVGNYFAPFDLWHLKTTKIMQDSFEKARNGGRNSMFHNNHDGTFTDVGAKLGIDDPGWTLSVGHGDINNDGWPDIYVANDFGPDQLFLNNGNGTFKEIARTSLSADTKKGMNIDFGDFDNDGWLDMYVSNITTSEYLKEGNMLWHNDASDEHGVPIFMDISVETGTYNGGWGWGAKFFDFDNDRDLDIVEVNGFISAGEGSYWYDLASWTVKDEDVSDALNWPPIGSRSFSGYEPARLWRNEGHQRFTEIAAAAGMDERHDGRGVVAFDYDNDGDLDLYIANQGAVPAFFRNDLKGDRHWLGLRLTGRPEAGSNRDAVGARVTVLSDGLRQIRELDGGNSYCGQSDRRLFFGMGDDPVIDTLEIRWPSRRVQVMYGVRCDQFLKVLEPETLSTVASLIPTSREARSLTSMGTESDKKKALPEAEVNALLTDLESKVSQSPDDLALASKYRAECIKLDEHERSIQFFEKLSDEHPTNRNVRLQFAVAYVDKIPTCGGMAAIVCKGMQARKSLLQLDKLIEADPKWWPAIYARAMNHLHWPRALGHSNDAVNDFGKCIELQKEGVKLDAHPYYVRAYVGLGDALAKDGNFEAAVGAWQEGLSLFPSSPDLKERVAIKSLDDATAYVERVRTLNQQIDTDFSFLVAR